MPSLRVVSTVAAVAIALALTWVAGRGNESVGPTPGPAAPTRAPAPTPPPRPREAPAPEPPQPRTDLPREAYDTLARIRAGGPFPYRQDGAVFGNYEGNLPTHARGYYHEFTVETPGSSDRGARRIVTGGKPPVEYFYTDDHYRSFRTIDGPP